jgi:hypothetical protein
MNNVITTTQNDVAISETNRNGKMYIQFDFHGYLDHPSAVKGIEIWRKFMAGDGKKDLIYNCSEMSGFDSTSRQMWQATMKEFKPQIGNIWMISENRFILAAAKTMGLLAGFSMKTARSLDEIK